MCSVGASGSTPPNAVPAGLAATAQVHVSAGYCISCAISSTAELACWGAGDQYSQINGIPSEARSNQLSVAVGSWFTCSLSLLGSVLCWGSPPGPFPTPGYVVVPAAARTGQVMLKVGWGTACSLDAYGTPQCWGWDPAGAISAMPAGLTGLLSIAPGGQFTCALTAERHVMCWGSLSYPAGAPLQQMTVVAGWNHAIGSSVRHSCALRRRHRLLCDFMERESDMLGGGQCRRGNPRCRCSDFRPFLSTG